MSASPKLNHWEHSETTCAYAALALAPSEVAAAEAHIAACPDCRRELESLRPVIDRFVSWPTDVLRPTASLQVRLAHRIAGDTGRPFAPLPARQWSEPEWEQVAPGIECKLLAADGERHRVSMLVRLAPGASYPPHTHAGVKELHLLDGELWINERKLVPGDYNGPEALDERVWSETGCTCVLVTSTDDALQTKLDLVHGRETDMTHRATSEATPQLQCPDCKKPMRFRTLSPLANGSWDLAFECDQCGRVSNVVHAPEDRQAG